MAGFLVAHVGAHGDDRISVVNEGLAGDALSNGDVFGLFQMRWDASTATCGQRHDRLLDINDINLSAGNADDIIAAHRPRSQLPYPRLRTHPDAGQFKQPK